MTPSIGSFAALVPCDLLDRSGEVFNSGRAAFSNPSDVYLLGYNPGSDPSDQRLRTVRSSIDEVSGKPERFSLYYEAWEEGRDPKMQQGIRHMFDRTGLNPCLTPSSNCIFVRSKGANDLRDRRRLENACWPFHEAVISAECCRGCARDAGAGALPRPESIPSGRCQAPIPLGDHRRPRGLLHGIAPRSANVRVVTPLGWSGITDDRDQGTKRES